MSESTLVAEERTAFGKGAARAVRRANKVPAVLYGHGQQPRHLSLPGHELMLALKHGGANALLTLKLADGDQLALPKAVTRDPIKGFLEHVDLLVVRRGEKVTVDIPINVSGETTSDVLVTHALNTLSVEAEATHIPSGVEVDVTGIEVGHSIHAGQIALPAGTTLITDPEAVVISAQAAPTAEQLEAELGEVTEPEAEAEAEGAEGEPGAEAAQGEEPAADKPGEQASPAAQ